MIDDNMDWQAEVAKAEREAAIEQNQISGGSRQKRRERMRRAVARARRRTDRRSDARKALKSVSKQLAPTPHERIEQRRSLNAKRLDKLNDQQVANIPPRELPSDGDAVDRQSRALPAFYQQQFGGRSQADLLAMRDWPRSRVPTQYTMREWRDQIRGELHRWAAQATRPDALKQPQESQPKAPTHEAPKPPPQSSPTPQPSIQETAATVVNQITGGDSGKPAAAPAVDASQVVNQVETSKPPTPESPKPQPPAMLSGPDVGLLHARAMDVISDRDKFNRWLAIHRDKVHPDSGKPINIEAETARTSPPRFQEAAKNIVDESMRPASQQFGGDSREPEPSRGSTALDVAQLGADVLGVVDPTGIVDAGNAAVSFTRAAFDKDRRGEHVKNGMISMASIIPFGDVAKLGKLGRAGKTLKNAEHLTGAARAAEHAGGAAAKGGKMEVRAAAEADAQSAKGDRSGWRSAAVDWAGQQAMNVATGGGGGVTPPPIATGGSHPPDDDSRDPSKIEKRNDAQKKRAELQKRYAEKLETAVLGLGAFGAATIAAVKVMGLVTDWNAGNAERGRGLADYNGKISGAFVGAEVADMRRNIKQGETTEDAISRSVAADTRNKDLKERFSSPIQSIGTDASAAATNLVNAIVNITDNMTGASASIKGLSQGAGWLAEKFNWLTKAASELSETLPGARLRERMDGGIDKNLDADRGTPWTNVLDDIRDGKFDVKSEAGDFFNEGL